MAPAEPDVLADEVLAERVLLGPTGLATAPGLGDGTPRSPDGCPCALYDPASGYVELPCTGEWGDFDQLVFRLGLREGAGCEMQVVMEREGRSLSTICGIGAMTRVPWHGWREVLYSSENFGLALGAPFGRVAKLRIRGHYGGPFCLGGVSLRKRRIPAGPRLTNRGFARAWDWSRPGMARAALAAEREDYPAMIRELRAYFLARKDPAHPFARRWVWPSSRDAAELLCRNVVEGHELGTAFDWGKAFREITDLQALDRHYFLVDLLHAWQDTHEPRYAAKLDEILSGWIAFAPVPFGHGGMGSRGWSSLTAGSRFKRTWLQVFFALLGEHAFRDRTWFDMLKGMYEHATFLMDWGSMGGTNWTVIEAQAIALIGIAFPEYRDSGAWRKEGMGRLSVEIADSVYPDGIHQELSPSYHLSSANAFTTPFEVARQNAIPVPAVYAERLHAMYRAMAALVRPDGTLPSHNDSGGYHLGQGTFFREGARLWDDPQMLWMASGGREGQAPSGKSHGFMNAGLLVMRSGPSPKDCWSLFDVGPFGAGHQHEDALGLETYAFGTPFLVDPGIANYRDDDWFRFYRSTAAHNTLMVDGGPQQRGFVESRAARKRDVSREIFWAAGRVVDVGAGAYTAGYRGVAGRFVHRRAVLFLKPDYWIVVDELEGEGRHTVEALWHFAPISVAADGLQIFATHGEDTRFVIKPLFEADLSVRLICGQRDPVQGWVAIHPESVPAPCAIHRWEGELPLRQVWVLSPTRGAPSKPTLRVMAKDGTGLRAEIAHADGARDVLHVRWGGWELAGPPTERTDAWMAIERLAVGGKTCDAALVNGSFLRGDEGRTLIKGSRSPFLES